MSGERRSEPGPGAIGAEAGRGRARRFQTGVRGLIVVVACGALVSWSARTPWEIRYPAAAVARRLESRAPSDRVIAARELVSAGGAEPVRAIPPLIAALGDPATEVRVEAAAALGSIASDAATAGSSAGGVRRAVAALFRSLEDPEPAVRAASIFALVRFDRRNQPNQVLDRPEMFAALAAMTGDRDDGVRLAALELLTRFRPLDAIAPPPGLIAALDAPSPRLRAAAIKALVGLNISLDPWLPSLLRGVDDDDPSVREACYWAYGREQPPGFSAAAIGDLVIALGSRARFVRCRAARALFPHARNPRAVVAIPALLALLRETIAVDPGEPETAHPQLHSEIYDQDPGLMAVELLGRLAPGTPSAGEVVAALAAVVRSGPPSRRGPAISALNEFGAAAEPAIPTLVQALRDTGGDSSSGATPVAEALGRIAPGTKSADAAVAALIKALDSDRDPRLAAMTALRAFGPKAAAAVPRLRALERDPDMRWAAALMAIEGATSEE